LAIIGVVVEHAVGLGFTAMFWWADRYRSVTIPNFDEIGSLTYYIYRAVGIFFFFSVPVLFFVSGYFTQLSSQKEKLGWGKVFFRIKRLAIPFIIWSILTILVDIVQGRNYTLWTAIVAIITGKSGPAFYFIPALIQLYLLAPFIVEYIQKKTWLVLTSAALIQMISVGTGYLMYLEVNAPIIKSLLVFYQSAIFTNHIFWFVLGIAIGFNLEKWDQLLDKVKWWLLGLSLAAFILGVFEWRVLENLSGAQFIGRPMTLILQAYVFFFVLTLLAFRDWEFPFAKQFAYLGSKSYGIYLVHLIILNFVAKTIYHFAPELLSIHLIYQLLLISTAIAIPLIMMAIAARFASGRYYIYLFGRR
jgi:membrane-bound acyltransferase YfiQ involved in biofilm formation